jgi:hypothetical protein
MKIDEQEKRVNEIEKEIDRLHALYNQYFMGIEKIEPVVPRKNLDRKINQLRREKIRNTALRFRLQMQIQKYNTQATYWGRVCRQIENGTYSRQVMLAKRRTEQRQQNEAQVLGDLDETLLAEEAYDVDLGDLGIDLDDPFAVDDRAVESAVRDVMSTVDDPFADAGLAGQSPATRKKKNAAIAGQSAGSSRGSGRAIDEIDDAFGEAATPKTTGPSSSPKPKPSPPAVPRPKPAARSAASTGAQEKRAPQEQPTPQGLTEKRAKQIYRTYMAARKKCQQPTDNISFRQVAKSLGQKYVSAKGAVEFKVVIRDGKAVITTVKQ